MIETVRLTKRYDRTVALNGVSFTVQPGEVVGLLGPNGAGKTTMLKMLTGYLPPSEGVARVAGLDVADHPLDVRRRIGYLPENNPLYDELAVAESLAWTAALRGLDGETRRQAIRRAVDACGLGDVLGKDIQELSKGYRQRVGLAQAILHDPEILILDEPTSGLDPNQQTDVRNLIHALRQRKTVLVSTHILSEARAACDRVLIIHQGAIVADGTPDMLSRQLSRSLRLLLELKASAPAAQEALSALAGVERAMLQKDEGGISTFVVESGAADVRESVYGLSVERRWPILQMTPETVSLEDVFKELTGK